jgi:predicted metal-dependent hydrolase
MTVAVVRKRIRHLHIGVYPPAGRVRVAAPLAVSDSAIRLAVISKLGWIRRHRERFAAQPRQSPRQMVSGESHYYLGRRYRLRVIENSRGGQVVLRQAGVMELHVPTQAGTAHRTGLLLQWYRRRLRDIVPSLQCKWEEKLGVQVSQVGIKRMKTKWGSCNRYDRRVWLNLELAKKPMRCLEYIMLHEMAHLLERRHNDGFIAIMDEHMPKWRQYRDELNRMPLSHEAWQVAERTRQQPNPYGYR